MYLRAHCSRADRALREGHEVCSQFRWAHKKMARKHSSKQECSRAIDKVLSPSPGVGGQFFFSDVDAGGLQTR